MKKIIFSAVIATLFFTACQKTDVPVPAPTLAGKWGVVNYQTKEWDNGVVVYDDTYIGKPADYMEFKSDNTVSFYLDGFGFIVPYQLQTDNKVVIDGDTYTIQSLTANSATLYLKYNYSTTNYDEETINLKR
jgi:hypothetical protein